MKALKFRFSENATNKVNILEVEVADFEAFSENLNVLGFNLHDCYYFSQKVRTSSLNDYSEATQVISNARNQKFKYDIMIWHEFSMFVHSYSS